MEQSIKNNSQTFSLLISQSRTNTLGNKTGTWRFVKPLYQNKTAPCSNVCPLGIDIAMVEMHTAKNEFEYALDKLLIENPFPAICGRVCFHPCETACNRQFLDQSVGIHHIERFLGNWGLNHKIKFDQYPSLNGTKIAIIGAGPAGLGAAYFARRLGYTCDVFEKSIAPGGLLCYGIPSYRLPEDILINELQRLSHDGIQFHYEHAFSIDQLDTLKQHYDAIFLCCGDSQAISLNIPGANHVIDGLYLLRQLRNQDAPDIAGTVAVIGGGNTAIDTSRSLLRIGCRPIIIYRRSRNEMPAHIHEINAALGEGVVLKECLAPISIERQSNQLDKLTLQAMKPDTAVHQGRKRYIPDTNLTETMLVNYVVSAIGAEMDMMWHTDQWDLCMSHCLMKNMSGMNLFWCGDLSISEKTVTHALASGKQAVLALDIFRKHGISAIQDNLQKYQIANGPALSFERYIQGEGLHAKSSELVQFNNINTAYFPTTPTHTPKRLPHEICIQSFDEVVFGYDEFQTVQEASRCFNCGICNDCDTCRIYCPEMAIQWENNNRHILMDYCKGCGICIVECPRDAMTLEVEP
ncbi:MAG: FAD-dependent pyridine nucleotide-disulfide oxidoreductase [Candidatus Magnetoglobus multicellularis str. Araruama]|uniref:dihydrouracil dehydrogenase (NAD(+)) n=1 Tax=Candidatus Magnetoglobus multicellularis str. Araruama TaxID=890399 RepID=A0A1V1P7X9_9BACT|nr:MAG: FAD-dependent pyridine nucleotide-disulfide oxidoreductase [Candidatus Magnetoglobus multicellularis str. Araruama]